MSLARLLLALVFFASASADAAVLRYRGVEAGDVAIAGNTLGLSKAPGTNSPGARDSIGTFITTNPASADTIPVSSPPWPAGTTSSWPFNSSTSELTLPIGSTVLYAELVWGGSTNYIEDVTASLDVSVGLVGPGGSCGSIPPDPATAATLSLLTGSGFLANYYMRSADVTSCVSTQGPGFYAVSGVPATQHESIDSLNAAGWTLIVAYRDTARPLRDLLVLVDGSFVDEFGSSSFSIADLATPAAGPVGGRLVVAALEGDASSDGDQIRIRPPGGSFIALSGPNNPIANFFASQINDADGVLTTSGSFGDANHDAPGATNVVGARQSFDTTGVVLSSSAGHLENDQTGAEVEAISSGDAFISFGFGLAIDRAPPAVPLLSPIGLALLALGIALGVESARPGDR